MTLEEIRNGCEVLPSGCWRWLGELHKGYPVIRRASVARALGVPRTKRVRVCHVAYALKYGSIPQGLLHLHKCNNSWCANPKHLYAGTQKDNALDRTKTGWKPTPRTGHRHSASARAKIRAARARQVMGPRSQETKDKIRAARLAWWKEKRSKIPGG